VDKEISKKHLPELETLQRQLTAQVFSSRARYFDPSAYKTFFDRAIRTVTRIKALDAHIFGDIEDIQIPQGSGTTDFEGRGYFTLSQFRPLENSIERCLALIHANAGKNPTEAGPVSIGLGKRIWQYFHPKAWRYAATIIGVTSSVYVYLYSQRPILDVIPAATPVQAEWKNKSHRFEIPLDIKNHGQATAVDHALYHVFFDYPPSFEDLRMTDAPDVAPGTSRPFSVVKYIRTKSLLASVNFFHYQNLIIVSQWKSDNLAHTGLTFHHALWCRLHYNPLGQSAISVVKSRFYLSWLRNSDSAFKSTLRKFTKGENINDAYDVEYLDFKRGDK